MNDFGSLGWTTFLTHKGPIYPTHIREFYSDFTYNDEDEVITVEMHNQTITWTLGQFGSLLNIPYEGRRFYSPNWTLRSLPNFINANDFITTYCYPNVNRSNILKKGLIAKNLLPKYNLWAKIFSFNVICKAGNHSHVHATQAALIHCLATGTRVNLAHLVAMRMSNLQKETGCCLPYGILLSNLWVLFQHMRCHVPYPVSQAPISLRSFKKMGLAGLKRSIDDRDGSDDDNDDEDEEENEEEEASVVNEDDASSEEEIAPYDPSDPFYSMSSPKQREILYRQNITQKKESSKLKRLLKKILQTCQSSKNVET